MTKDMAYAIAQSVLDHYGDALAVVSQDDGSDDHHRRTARTWTVAVWVGDDIILLRDAEDWAAYLRKHTKA